MIGISSNRARTMIITAVRGVKSNDNMANTTKNMISIVIAIR